jgi:hypothetical protein
MGKINGAVGNYNARLSTRQLTGTSFAEQFDGSLGLQPPRKLNHTIILPNYLML